MTGGLIVIEGDAGDRAGDRMRRGTIFMRGKCGAFAGSRMVGGTIWSELGFGTDPGLLLRRGTLIGPSVERMLPTFADAGKHDLVILRILSRYMRATLGARAPKPTLRRRAQVRGRPRDHRQGRDPDHGLIP